MRRLPPISTRPDTLFPYTTLFRSFGIPMYWTAGAVVSGAFFGDKVSPLSDTTNLAPAVTGVDLFPHIQNMMPTTVPTMLIAFALYRVAGFTLIPSDGASFERSQAHTSALQPIMRTSYPDFCLKK